MRTFVSVCIQVAVLTAAFFYAGLWLHPASILIAAIALIVIAVWQTLARQHKLDQSLQDNDAEELGLSADSAAEADAADEIPHPISVVLASLVKAILLLAFMVPFFAAARLATPYRLPFEQQAEMNATTARPPRFSDKVKITTAAVPLAIVHHGFIPPQTHFIDVAAADNIRGPLGNFVLTVYRKMTQIGAVNELYEEPVNVSVLFDVSGSIVESEPFLNFAIDNAKTSIAALQNRDPGSMSASVRFGSFGDSVSVVQEWINPEDIQKDEIEKRLRAIPPSTASAVANSIANESKALSDRPGSRTLLVLSDFANNVASPYNDRGLAALAKSHSVRLLLVCLKTREFPAQKLEQIQFLAQETGGLCLDAADPNTPAALRAAFAVTRRHAHVYRVLFDGPSNIDLPSIFVSAEEMREPPRVAAAVR